MRIYRYLLILPIISLFAPSCNKENSPRSKYPFYFVGTINNKEVRYETDDLTMSYKCSIISHAFDVPPKVNQYEGTYLWSQTDVYRNQIFVRVLKQFSNTPTLEDRKAIWRVGNFNYGLGNLGGSGAITIDGVSISYLDENLLTWNTELGPQTGSKFTVTEMWSSKDGTMFKAIFSCTLYDGNGHSIKLENGEISGRLFTP